MCHWVNEKLSYLPSTLGLYSDADPDHLLQTFHA